jgi:DNA-directed RNA polymerase subunit RPC12/RpoP
MAKTKYMMHHCAYCHKQTKMEIVGEMHLEGEEQQSNKVWYRCTRCKHSALLDRSEILKEKNGHHAPIDRTSSTEYSQAKVFTIGQTIYHVEWDDYGTVTAKRKASNGINAITVAFEKQGEKSLVENITIVPENETISSIQ